MNRLKLDFSLETAEERSEFIKSYIVQFSSLTRKEAETIANYLLWGKDSPEDSPGASDIELETKWTKVNPVESLDALLESQIATHTQIYQLNNAPKLKKPRIVFSRTETRQNCPPYLLPSFEELWRIIDQTDLEICLYEIETGKRTKPPRPSLLSRFTEEEIEQIRGKAKLLTPREYLKARHRLIDLRREQFSLKDVYSEKISFIQEANPEIVKWDKVVFDADVEIFPLGLANTKVGKIIFQDDFDPWGLTKKEKQLISQLIWKKKEGEEKIKPHEELEKIKQSKKKSKTRNQPQPLHRNRFIDFRELESVYHIFLLKEELREEGFREQANRETEANQDGLIQTLDFYSRMAGLTDVQLEILRLKVEGYKNQEIADRVNPAFDKSYTANYISTIFRQKIIKKINAAAVLHQETIENCFFEENFKECSCCGRVLLLDARNWVRKSRSPDGFQKKCKRCEKEARWAKKKSQENKVLLKQGEGKVEEKNK